MRPENLLVCAGSARRVCHDATPASVTVMSLFGQHPEAFRTGQHSKASRKEMKGEVF